MIISGEVKRAELLNLGQWEESMFVVTVDIDGIEFRLPLSPEEVSTIQLGTKMKFDIECKPIVGNQYVKPIEELAVPVEAIAAAILKEAGQQDNGNVNNPKKTAEAEPNKIPDLKIENMEALYSSMTQLEQVEKSELPVIETSLEEIAPEEIDGGMIATEETTDKNKEEKNSDGQDPIENTILDPIDKPSDNPDIEEDTGTEEEAQVETYSAVEDFGKFMKDGIFPEDETEDDNEEDDDEDDE